MGIRRDEGAERKMDNPTRLERLGREDAPAVEKDQMSWKDMARSGYYNASGHLDPRSRTYKKRQGFFKNNFR